MGRRARRTRQLRLLREVAGRATYVGSVEHKRHPSTAGPPRLRPSASACPPDVTAEMATEWLREAIGAGWVSALADGAYPRYVWTRKREQWWQARLTNRGRGEYKGWPIDPAQDDVPPEILRALA